MTSPEQKNQSPNPAQAPQSNPRSQPSDQAGQSRATPKQAQQKAPEPPKVDDNLAKLIQKMQAGKTDGQRVDQMRKDVVTTLNRSISSMGKSDLDSRKATVAGLREVRGELLQMSHVSGIDNSDILASLDQMIAAGEKQVGLTKAMREAVTPKESVFAKFTKGFLGEANPLLKMAANVVKDGADKIKAIRERSKESAITEEDVDSMKKSLEKVSENTTALKDAPAKKPAAPTAEKVETTQPEKKLEKVAVPKEGPAPTAQRVPATEAPMPAMEPFPGHFTPPEALEALEPKTKRKKSGTPAKRDSKGKFVSATKERAPAPGANEQGRDLKATAESKVKEAGEAQAKAIDELKQVIESRFGEKPSTAADPEAEKRSLDNIQNELEKIRGLQEQANALARDQKLEGSKERLRRGKGGAKLAAPAAAGKGGAAGGGLIGNALSGILSAVLSGPLTALALGAGKVLLKGARGVMSLLNPMNWVKGGAAVLEALKPTKLLEMAGKAGTFMKGLYTKGADKLLGASVKASEAIGGGMKAAGGVLERVTKGGKELAEGAGGKAMKMLKGIKVIPFVGQIATVAMAAWDFAKGWDKADELLGKNKEELTFYDKLSGGIGSAMGSVAGIVDGVASIFGFDTNFEDEIASFVAKKVNELPEAAREWAGKAGEVFTSIKDSVSEWVNGVLKGAANAIAEKVPGGKWLMDKLGFGGDTATTVAPDAAAVKEPAPAATVTAAPAAGVGEMTREEKLRALEAIDRPSNQMPQRVAEHNQRMDQLDILDKQRATATAQVNQNINNSRSVTTNNYTQAPLTTRNPDDSHRKGL